MSVVLKNGVWIGSERVRLRARAAQIGAKSELHFIDVSHEELLRRLEKRNAALPKNTFSVTSEQLALYSKLFKRPAQDELSDV